MTQVRFTYEDLEDFPEDGKRRELINGDLLVAPAPNTLHQRIVMRLSAALFNHADAQGLGEVFTAPLDVIFNQGDVIEPDIVFVSRERAQIVTARGIEGPPDWVIEVLSPSTRTRDLGVKKKLCQREGVRVYWAIDPDARTITAWDGDWNDPRAFSSNDIASVSVLAGFSLVAKTLFAELPSQT